MISFPPGTEMFQFPGSPVGISGSTRFGPLPRTYRSHHAHHLMTPRHPPRALLALDHADRPSPGLPRDPAFLRCLSAACDDSHATHTPGRSLIGPLCVSRRGANHLRSFAACSETCRHGCATLRFDSACDRFEFVAASGCQVEPPHSSRSKPNPTVRVDARRWCVLCDTKTRLSKSTR